MDTKVAFEINVNMAKDTLIVNALLLNMPKDFMESLKSRTYNPRPINPRMSKPYDATR
jgi:hypothetical protein